jgi:hypothetical protein
MKPSPVIPLRPAPELMASSTRKSFARAVAAMVLNPNKPQEIVRAYWEGDDAADKVLRAISSPIDTTQFWQATPSVILPALAPASAAARLFELAKDVSLQGVTQIKIPRIDYTGRPTSIPFVGEGQPGPVFAMTSSGLTLGPVRKLLMFAAVSHELELASGETASQIIGEALELAAEVQLDAALFSNAAATSSAPAGLLNGVTPITGTSTAGMITIDKIGQDLGAIADGMTAKGINPDSMCIVTTGSLTMKLRVHVGPLFGDVRVFTSTGLPAGEVIGIQPRGVYTGFNDAAVSVEIARQPALHFDSSPLPVVDNTGKVASPVYSAYQMDQLQIKLRSQMTWVAAPGCVQVVTGVTW